MKLKAVIFDLDGTLTNTLDSLTVFCNEIRSNYGLDSISHDEVKSNVGHGLQKLVERVLPNLENDKEKLNDITKKETKRFLQNASHNVRLYSGLDKVLTTLELSGISLNILTNKVQDGAEQVVQNVLSRWNFTCVVGDDFEHPIKPDPYGIEHIIKTLNISKDEVIYVGDSDVDIETAKNAKVPVIAVTWGFRSKKNLQALNPDFLVDDTESLLNCILEFNKER